MHACWQSNNEKSFSTASRLQKDQHGQHLYACRRVECQWLLKPSGNVLVWTGAATQVDPSCVTLKHRTAYD